MNVKKVYIGCDHAGFWAKEKIIKILNKFEVVFEDVGTFDDEKSVDYVDFAKKVCDKVVGDKDNNSFGILICGSGTGMQIAANKVNGIRAAFCYDKYSAKMARIDNDANVLTLRGRKFCSFKYKGIVKAFLETEFSSEKRHIRRINKLKKLEK